jgi:hypothetical protein
LPRSWILIGVCALVLIGGMAVALAVGSASRGPVSLYPIWQCIAILVLVVATCLLIAMIPRLARTRTWLSTVLLSLLCCYWAIYLPGLLVSRIQIPQEKRAMAAAMRQFVATHGRLPATLNELLPHGTTLRYALDSVNGVALYDRWTETLWSYDVHKGDWIGYPPQGPLGHRVDTYYGHHRNELWLTGLLVLMGIVTLLRSLRRQRPVSLR